LAAAAKALMEFGMENVAAHEDELIAHTLKEIRSVPGIEIYGQSDPDKSGEKVGVVPFNLDGKSHFMVAAILGYEGGVGVRSGCFCAHPYVVHLLQLPAREQHQWRDQALRGDKSTLPGMVRASFGCYNNEDDVDKLVEMLHRISRDDFTGKYRVHAASGEYIPVDYHEPFDDFFSLEPRGELSDDVRGACGR